MLIRWLERGSAETFPQLLDILRSRLRYLESRAAELERRKGFDDSSWQLQMAAASLWLDAAETAISLGLWARARRALRRGAAQLVALGLPAGAALDLAFVPPHDGQRNSLALLSAWNNRRQAARTEPSGPNDAAPVGGAFGSAADAYAQSWAYVRLAQAHVREPQVSAVDDDLLMAQLAAPFGRQGLPLDSVVLAVHCVQMRRLGEPMPPDLQDGVAHTLAKMFQGVHAGLGWARHNHYLWHRGLAATPLFDLDNALLVATMLRGAGADDTAALLRATGRFLSRDERRFARIWVRCVQRLALQ